MVKHVMRTMPSTGVDSFQKWGETEIALNEELQKCKENVHLALCDNIDTRRVLETLRDLVNAGNSYVLNKDKTKEAKNRALLEEMAAYITKIFNILGLNSKHEYIGFSASTDSSNMNTEEVVMPYLSALADFRGKVRKEAISIKNGPILNLCDEIRNEVLPELGVRLEDKEDDVTVIKLVDKAELLKEKEAKKLAEEKKKAEKEKKKKEAEAKAAELEAKKKIKPSEMFLSETDKYSKFDDKVMFIFQF